MRARGHTAEIHHTIIVAHSASPVTSRTLGDNIDPPRCTARPTTIVAIAAMTNTRRRFTAAGRFAASSPATKAHRQKCHVQCLAVHERESHTAQSDPRLLLPTRDAWTVRR